MEKGGKREKEEKYYPNRNNGWQNRFDYFTCRKGEKKKKKKQVDVMPVPLESAFSHSMLHNTYLSHFPSTLCVNDDAQRPVALPCSPTC